MSRKRLSKAFDNDSPVAVYSSGTQSLVGVFRQGSIAGEFCFGKEKKSRVYSYLNNKTKARVNLLGIPLAFRYANVEKINMLGNEEFIIMEGWKDAKKEASLHRAINRAVGDTSRLLPASNVGRQISKSEIDEIERLYTEERMSTKEVAKAMNIGIHTVQKYLPARAKLRLFEATVEQLQAELELRKSRE